MLIFAIDDENEVLEYNEKIIERASGGVEIMVFRTGGSALAAIRKGHLPDVVYSDVDMPGVSGIVLAARIKEISPNTKVVFVTETESHAYMAFQVGASGYHLKPLDEEMVKKDLDPLRKMKYRSQDKLEVRCFGHFDVLWHGQPLIFLRKKSKELLAYLIARDGAACTSGEIAMALWQEGGDIRAEQNRIRVLISDLRKTLSSIGMEDVIIREHGETAVNTELIDCDYYRMLDGDSAAIGEYRGQYMVEYSWAEMRNADLLQFIKSL